MKGNGHQTEQEKERRQRQRQIEHRFFHAAARAMDPGIAAEGSTEAATLTLQQDDAD